jgi:hypothetical protein
MRRALVVGGNGKSADESSISECTRRKKRSRLYVANRRGRAKAPISVVLKSETRSVGSAINFPSQRCA